MNKLTLFVMLTLIALPAAATYLFTLTQYFYLAIVNSPIQLLAAHKASYRKINFFHDNVNG